MHTVLVIGGYGFFGARIAAELAKAGTSRLLVAGRDLEQARGVAKALGLRSRCALRLDAAAPDLAETLGARGVSTVIHAAGPFQGQGYGVAAAAILAGANYLDLADGRAFVAGISTLDAAARTAREGEGRDGQPLVKRWHLLVERNDGPFVPCGAALALASKLAAGKALPKGAMPCVGLLTVEEYLAPLKSLAITIEADPR